MIARALVLMLAVPAVGLAILALGARLVLPVQPTAPQIGPQPTWFQSPCPPLAQLMGSCRPGWVDANTKDWLDGGYDI